MIGLDTNVIVRYVMRDDPIQTSLADECISTLTPRNPGYVSLIVLVELWWVFGRAYQRTVKERLALFQELLRVDELRVENSPTVIQALSAVERGADFADFLIQALASQARCSHTVTFDIAAAHQAGMRLLEAVA